MENDITILVITATSIGFFHTLFGPDHYLPFIVMSKARKWTLFKTTWVTILCGIGHVGSSILLGIIGIAFGIGVTKLEFIEGFRGNIAAWLLLVFGLIYFIWGLWRALQNKPHTHFHRHDNDIMHSHHHKHIIEHDHIHQKERAINLTPWILFTIFVFGPCEPLIPILMYPSSSGDLMLVTAAFAIVTIATMLAIVLISSFGINFLPLGKLERYTHAIAGAIIFISGLGIIFLGL